MMHMICRLSTSFAFSFGAIDRSRASLFPPNAATFWFPSSVSRMCVSARVICLPNSHAWHSTKHTELAVEVTCGTRKRFAALRTHLSNLVARLYWAFSFITIVPTFKFAVLFLATGYLFSARFTMAHTANPKAVRHIAFSVAEFCVFLDALVGQQIIAVSAIHGCVYICSAHFGKRSIEKEPKYFAIAKERIERELRQMLLPL